MNVRALEQPTRRFRSKTRLASLAVALIVIAVLSGAALNLSMRLPHSGGQTVRDAPRGLSPGRFPASGESTSIALGGLIDWNFSLSMTGWISGNASIDSAAGGVTAELLNQSNWQASQARSNYTINNLTVAGPASQLGSGVLGFGFSLSSGTWHLILSYPSYPGGSCSGSCGSDKPAVLTWLQGIVVNTEGSFWLE